MKFAKVLFYIAGIWGILVITPLYFIFDNIGIKDPPAITHSLFFYGFAGDALLALLFLLAYFKTPGSASSPKM